MEIEKSILTREGFEARLADSPEKLVAYRESMEKLRGNYIEQTLFHLHAVAIFLGIPWTEKEKAAARGD